MNSKSYKYKYHVQKTQSKHDQISKLEHPEQDREQAGFPLLQDFDDFIYTLLHEINAPPPHLITSFLINGS